MGQNHPKNSSFLNFKTIWPIALIYGLFVFWVSFLLPVGDDWAYFTKPTFTLSYQNLLPKSWYWRPLDVIFGRILGFAPGLFPLLNHAWIVFGHFIAIFALLKLLNLLKVDRNVSFIASIIFGFSPGVAATVFSVDSINQTYALSYGLLGTLVYLKGNKPIHLIGWLGFTLLALFSKESGIVWFVATPMIGYLIKNENKLPFNLKDKSTQKLYLQIILGLLLAIFYFYTRIVIFNNPEVLGSSDPNDRLHLTPFSISFIKNIFLLFGSGLTSIDSVALFLPPRNYLLSILTIILNLPYLILLLIGFINALKSGKWFWLLGFILVALVVSSPHLVMKDPAVMHAYPTIFFSCLIIGLCLNSIKWNTFSKVALICYFLAAVISNVHIWKTMYEYGKSGQRITDALFKNTTSPPKKAAFIFTADFKPGYSVFKQTPLLACSGGLAMKSYYGWKYPEILTKIRIDEKNRVDIDRKIKTLIEETRKTHDVIWLVDGSKVSVVY